MGLPDIELGGPGGGGMGLPDDEVGDPPGAGALGRGGPPVGGAAGGRGAPAGGGVGRAGGGAAGRGVRAAAGRSGARAEPDMSAGAGAPADAAGRATPGSSSRRVGRGGCSLPDDVTRRPGGGGGAGRPAVRCGGAAGGVDGRGSHRSSGGRDPASGDDGAGLAARAGASASGASALAAAGAGVSAGTGVSAGAGSGPALAPALAAGAAAAGLAPDRVSALAAALLPPLAGLAGLACFGSSGCSVRVRPSRSARRRTRSACASSMPEECVLTPMPNARERSSVSLFVIPSSLASSWTRIFAAKVVSDQPFVFLRARTTHPVVRIAALHPRADHYPGTNSGLETRASAPVRPHTTVTERSCERTTTDGQRLTRSETGSTEPRSAPRQCTALNG
jgi:hypothetical protein